MEEREKNDKKLLQKREENHKLDLAIEVLQFEKNRLDNGITLLNASKNSFKQVETEIHKLADSWKKLADFCLVIRSDISKIMVALDNSRRDGTSLASSVSSNSVDLLTEQLKKTERDMRIIAKTTEMYGSAYSAHLADLVSQLEQMMTIKDETPMSLEEKLVEACNRTSSEIGKLFSNEKELMAEKLL